MSVSDLLTGFGVEREFQAAFAAVCEVLTDTKAKTQVDPEQGLQYWVDLGEQEDNVGSS